jgi:hypothetical protein
MQPAREFRPPARAPPPPRRAQRSRGLAAASRPRDESPSLQSLRGYTAAAGRLVEEPPDDEIGAGSDASSPDGDDQEPAPKRRNLDRQGEAVFLQLDEDAVRKWEGREVVRDRARALEQAYRSWTTGSRQEKPPPFPGIRFYLLHSLSHLLMSAISLECGYSASALRERLYCSLPGATEAMAAILVTTGTSGTEGTLGGLVEEGRRMRRHLRRAWDLGRLCSGDPVCAAHSPADDPAERFLEGAACHGRSWPS